MYSPELVPGDVVFTNYEMILGKPTEEQWLQGRTEAKGSGAKSKKASKRKRR